MFATLAGAYPPPAAREPRPPDARGGGPPLDALRAVLRDQLEAGLELLGDGAVGVPDPVAATVAGLEGVRLGGPVEWFGTRRSIHAPRVRSAAVEPGHGLVERWQVVDGVARDLAAERHEAPRPVRASLVGPYTLGRLADRGRLGRRRLTVALAEALGAVVAELGAAGTLVVQVDEPALALIGVDDGTERSLAADALRRLTAAAPAVHLSLAVMHGSAEGAGAALLYDAPFHSYFFDLCAGPDNWRLVSRAPADRGIIAGVEDARRPALDSREVLVWGARYAAALNGRGLERVGIAPSADLDHLTPAQARAKIEGLAAAARLAGLEDVEELRQAVHPRAVDLRSAALGRYDPGAPSGPRRRLRPAR